MKVNLETAEVIGEGNFAKIYKFYSKEHKCYLVARLVFSYKAEKDELQKQKEINRELMKVTSPYILKIYGIEETQENIIYYTEYCEGGSLFQCLDSLPGHMLNLETAMTLLLKIAKGIQVLHNNKITHRDLKPENILLVRRYKQGGEVPEIKIADFGLSTNSIIMKTLAGTKEYIAPEQAKFHNYTNSVDVWALGIILDEMIHGLPYFTGESNDDVFKKVTTEEFSVRNQALPQGIQELLVQMLRKKSFERPTIGEVIQRLEVLLGGTKGTKGSAPVTKSSKSQEQSLAASCARHKEKAQYLRDEEVFCQQCLNEDLIPLDQYLKTLADDNTKLFRIKAPDSFHFETQMQQQLEAMDAYNKLFSQLKLLFQCVNTSSLDQQELRVMQQGQTERREAKSKLTGLYQKLLQETKDQFFRTLDLEVEKYLESVME